MYDVNDHPHQDELNKRLGKILANTMTELHQLSEEMDVDLESLCKQFVESHVRYLDSKELMDMSEFNTPASPKNFRRKVSMWLWEILEPRKYNPFAFRLYNLLEAERNRLMKKLKGHITQLYVRGSKGEWVKPNLDYAERLLNDLERYPPSNPMSYNYHDQYCPATIHAIERASKLLD